MYTSTEYTCLIAAQANCRPEQWKKSDQNTIITSISEPNALFVFLKLSVTWFIFNFSLFSLPLCAHFNAAPVTLQNFINTKSVTRRKCLITDKLFATLCYDLCIRIINTGDIWSTGMQCVLCYFSVSRTNFDEGIFEW